MRRHIWSSRSLGIALALAAGASPAWGGELRPPRCTDVDLTLTLATNGVGTVNMEAEWCVGRDNPEPRAALFFVHGSGHDLSEERGAGVNKRYDRVAHATSDGWGVLSITRIGSGGRSTTPADPADVDIDLMDESLLLAVSALHGGGLRAANGQPVSGPIAGVACFGQSLSFDYVARLAAEHPGACQVVVAGGATYNAIAPAPAAWLDEVFAGRHSYPAYLDPSIDDPSVPCPDPTPGPAMRCYTTTSPIPDENGERAYQTFFLDPLEVGQNIVVHTEAAKSFTSNSLVLMTAFGDGVRHAGLVCSAANPVCPTPADHPFSHRLTAPFIYFGGDRDRAVCGPPLTATTTCTAAEIRGLMEPYFTATTIDVVLVEGGPHAAHFADGFGEAWREVDGLLRSKGLTP